MKKTISLLMLTLYVLSFGCVMFLSGCTDTDGEPDPEERPTYIMGDEVTEDSTSEDDAGKDETENSSKDWVIPFSSVTADVNFFGIMVDGTYMEVIVLKSGNSYRTAFNTCRICYGSRTAYYKQSGNYLVCQNCGSRTALSSVGVNSSEDMCNPYPILDSDRTITEESIIIPYSFLVNVKNLFKTWKVT